MNHEAPHHLPTTHEAHPHHPKGGGRCRAMLGGRGWFRVLRALRTFVILIHQPADVYLLHAEIDEQAEAKSGCLEIG